MFRFLMNGFSDEKSSNISKTANNSHFLAATWVRRACFAAMAGLALFTVSVSGYAQQAKPANASSSEWAYGCAKV